MNGRKEIKATGKAPLILRMVGTAEIIPALEASVILYGHCLGVKVTLP